LYSALSGEKFVIEFIEQCNPEPLALASFQTDINDILFGSPPLIKERVIRTEYLSIVLHTTRHFTENFTPLLNADIRVQAFHTENPISEVEQDNGKNVTLGIDSQKFPSHHQESKDQFREMTPRPCQRMLIKDHQCRHKVNENEKKRELFLVRHVDDKLIGRTPSAEASTPTILDRGYTMAGTLRSPWRQSTSQLDTVASLMRRSPKAHPTSKVLHKRECDWCSAVHHSPIKSNKSRLVETCIDFSGGQTEVNCKPGSCSCCKLHHYSESCTICQLYKQYFDVSYPRHVT